MTENNVLSFLQQSLRTVVGATADAVETLQDTQKRNEAIAKVNAEWQKKSEEWVVKGTLTEAEARQIIEDFWQNRQTATTTMTTTSPQEIQIDAPVNDPYTDIQDLTTEIIALRAELEKLNSPN